MRKLCLLAGFLSSSLFFAGCLPQAATIEVSPSPTPQERLGVYLPSPPAVVSATDRPVATKASSPAMIFGLYRNWIGEAQSSTEIAVTEKFDSYSNGLTAQIMSVPGRRLTVVKKTDKAETYFLQVDVPQELFDEGFDSESGLSADGGLGGQWGFVKKLPNNMMQILKVSYTFPKEAAQNEANRVGIAPTSMTYTVFLSDPTPSFSMK